MMKKISKLFLIFLLSVVPVVCCINEASAMGMGGTNGSVIALPPECTDCCDSNAPADCLCFQRAGTGFKALAISKETAGPRFTGASAILISRLDILQHAPAGAALFSDLPAQGSTLPLFIQHKSLRL